MDFFVCAKTEFGAHLGHFWISDIIYDHLTVATDIGGATYEDLTTIDIAAQSAPFHILNRLRLQWAIRTDLQHMVIQSRCLEASFPAQSSR